MIRAFALTILLFTSGSAISSDPAPQAPAKASTAYARQLFQGSGGITDFKQAAGIFMDKARRADGEYARDWYHVSALDLHGINTGILQAAWWDYFLQHKELSKQFRNEHVSGEVYLRSELDPFLAAIQGATDEAAVKTVSHHSTATACQLVFNHRHEDIAQFQRTQQAIFSNKAQAEDLAAAFYQSIQDKYHDALTKAGIDDGVINLNYPGTSVDVPLKILVDFMAFKARIIFDDGVKSLPVMVYAHEQYPPLLLNIWMATQGIGAECKDETIRFYVDDSSKPAARFITTHFITDWGHNKAISLGDAGLQGNGRLNYGDAFSFSGLVVNSLPNGFGEYNLGGNIFQGQRFVDGLLNGDGAISINGHAMEKGAYRHSQLNGNGETVVHWGEMVFGNARAIYKGVLVDGEAGGNGGTMTYFDAGYEDVDFTLDQSYPPLWSFTGTFNQGKKVSGTCKIYSDRKVVDSFSCAFYEDTLVKIGDVSLLPPGMTSVDGLRKYHR